MQADYEERQASQSGRLAFDKRKLKGAAPASAAAATSGAGGRVRRPGMAVPPDDAGQASGTAAQRGTSQAGARAGGTGQRKSEQADAAQPATKKAKRAVLSFGDDSEEDGE